MNKPAIKITYALLFQYESMYTTISNGFYVRTFRLLGSSFQVKLYYVYANYMRVYYTWLLVIIKTISVRLKMFATIYFQ